MTLEPLVATPHPAKFSEPILSLIRELVCNYTPLDARVIDPFAGTGLVHTLPRDTTGVEIEPEWAEQTIPTPNQRTIIGSALDMPFRDNWFQCAVTSPCYGNRMADNHIPSPSDTSTRITYRHKLGRPLTEGSAGGLQWGKKYRVFHEAAWTELARVLVPDSIFILNISDHIRKGEVQPVTIFHVRALRELGFRVVRWEKVETRRMRMGANANTRVGYESVIVLRYSP